MLTILYFVFFWTSNASVNIHSSSLYSRLITFINHNHSELNLHKAKSVNELHYTLYTVLLDDNFFILAGPRYYMILDSGCLYLYKHSGEARIRPLPKRSQQKKNEPVQFFQRSLQEVEAHSPSGQSRPLPGITQIHERSRKTPLSKKKSFEQLLTYQS